MTHKKSHLILSICVCLTLPSFSASAQQKSKSWLDRPLQNWNRGDDGFPKLPRPTLGIEIPKRCLKQVRPPTIPAEQALVRQGWKLYGSIRSYGLTQVITATSGFDGMCRPMQYQAFVYWEGRYAGTLSPVTMNSRTDGSISTINLTSTTNISTVFNRYRPSDAYCCPSGKSSVQFNLRPDDLPYLSPVSVSSGENR